MDLFDYLLWMERGASLSVPDKYNEHWVVMQCIEKLYVYRIANGAVINFCHDEVLPGQYFACPYYVASIYENQAVLCSEYRFREKCR